MNVTAALTDLLERELTEQVIGSQARPGVARMLNYHVYHTLRSKGSAPGYPDWTLVRERVVFLELKRMRGVVSDAQKQWLGWLLAAGAEAYLVRPDDLDALTAVLSARGFVPGSVAARAAAGLREKTVAAIGGA